jgi:hypothetical protein
MYYVHMIDKEQDPMVLYRTRVLYNFFRQIRACKVVNFYMIQVLYNTVGHNMHLKTSFQLFKFKIIYTVYICYI